MAKKTENPIKMKFSVLLPTRNRLHYLKYAIASVLTQDYHQWELIISDNDSQEDIAAYVHSLNDARIKYFRTKEFVSVTENWNNSLNLSTGDYVIMLGDDDILLRNYFSTMLRLLKEYKQPNLIYANAYLFFYPGVFPGSSQGVLQTCRHYQIFEHSNTPTWLTKEKALYLIQGHLDFNPRFMTNMQFILMKRSLTDKLRVNNQFFHSPYPDVYAMSILMLEAETILIYPQELVAIGVTPKSTGNFIVNNDEKKGLEFLNISKELDSIDSLSSVILPGSLNLTSWLVAMESVKIYFKDKIDLKVNYFLYRRLHISQSINSLFSQSNSTTYQNIYKIFRSINLKEKLTIFFPIFIRNYIKKIVPRFIHNLLRKNHPSSLNPSAMKNEQPLNDVLTNIFEIFQRHENGQLFSMTQIMDLLERADSCSSVCELCREEHISLQFYEYWKDHFKLTHPSLH